MYSVIPLGQLSSDLLPLTNRTCEQQMGGAYVLTARPVPETVLGISTPFDICLEQTIWSRPELLAHRD